MALTLLMLIFALSFKKPQTTSPQKKVTSDENIRYCLCHNTGIIRVLHACVLHGVVQKTLSARAESVPSCKAVRGADRRYKKILPGAPDEERLHTVAVPSIRGGKIRDVPVSDDIPYYIHSLVSALLHTLSCQTIYKEENHKKTEKEITHRNLF